MDNGIPAIKEMAMANIPVELECPEKMLSTVREVLAGEYEPWFFGEGLTILDLGANVGSFSLWANMRWPHSRIHAYEPQPETFQILRRNVAHQTNIVCHSVAVYPSTKERELFWTRYAGDGESGLVAHVAPWFADLSHGRIFEVPVLHPRDLPPCDVIKLDVEGAEGPILSNMDLARVSLILVEYHDNEIRDNIKELLLRSFKLVGEKSRKWDALLPHSEYKKTLKGHAYGIMHFHNAGVSRLRRGAPLLPPRSIRRLLTALPRATKAAFWRRSRKVRGMS